jgi:mRNA-degrading endonuclease YafQ of YafQ-DinJ toxin-antitoxin module
MEIHYLSKFERQYKKLPLDVQEEAEKKEKLFRKNPFNPQLKTHKLGGSLSGFWAFSITHSHRIIFEFVDSGVVRFYQIGPHDIYK